MCAFHVNLPKVQGVTIRTCQIGDPALNEGQWQNPVLLRLKECALA